MSSRWLDAELEEDPNAGEVGKVIQSLSCVLVLEVQGIHDNKSCLITRIATASPPFSRASCGSSTVLG